MSHFPWCTLKMSRKILKPHAAIRLWHDLYVLLQFRVFPRFVLCFLRDCCRVHLAVSQLAYWRRWRVWIKFHPYALELFSHVSPAEPPVAFCCQRNYVTGFHSLSGPRTLFLIIFFFFLELLFLTSLEESSSGFSLKRRQPFIFGLSFKIVLILYILHEH